MDPPSGQVALPDLWNNKKIVTSSKLLEKKAADSSI